MVIDSSAVIAILRREPEMPAVENAIRGDPVRLMSAVSKFETGMVAIGRGLAGVEVLDRLLGFRRDRCASGAGRLSGFASPRR